MKKQEDALDIIQVLQADMPPGARQRIAYHVSTFEEHGVIHGDNCAPGCGRHENVVYHEATGADLEDAWQKHKVFSVCDYYPENQVALATALIRCKFGGVFGGTFGGKAAGGANNFENRWSECGLLLNFEAAKPANVDAWCLWACGKTAEQIRENARQELEQADAGGSERTMVFEAYGGNNTSWPMACYDHVSVSRDTSFETYAIIHGVIPCGIHGHLNRANNGMAVPVGDWFSPAHLTLAAQLYEEQIRGEYTGVDPQELAEKSVETARLVLS